MEVAESKIGGLSSLAMRSSWDVWFESFGVIKDVSGVWRGYGHQNALIANYLQQQISDVQRWFKANNLPARHLLLKPRQRGCSTFSSAGMYQEWNLNPINGCIIGAKGKQAKNLFKMISSYSNNDEYDWGTKRVCRSEDAHCSFPDGQTGTLEILSAKEYDPGRSGTYQFVLATEAARWAEEGVSNAADVLSGLLKCVQLVPGSTVILETTAAGASGDFHERWTNDAMDFEQLKAAHARGDNIRGVFCRTFAPWFMFPELSFELTGDQQYKLEQKLGRIDRYNSPDFGTEQDIMNRFNLSIGQLAWRRYAIDQECKRDPRVFEQDYPSTWESAFLTSGNRVFNSSGIRALRRKAKEKEVKWSMLERTDSGQVVLRETDSDEGLLKIWELPKVGRRYSIPVDVMTGREQTVGKNPDKHSVLVMRSGEWVNGRGWSPPAVVARIVTPCRWDLDLLSEWIKRLSDFYGGCVVVPEVNGPGLALIENLKRKSVSIFMREVYDEYERKFTRKLGFQTTTATRPLILGNTAKALREVDLEGSGVDIWCEDILDECSQFIRKQSGREEAMDGCKDDDVLALSVGLSTLEAGTPYTKRVLTREVHPDLRELDEQENRAYSKFA